MMPTAGQQEALDKLPVFLEHPTSRIFRLSGSAGTGKTYTSRQVPGMVTKGRVMGTAPTHKAVGVLQTQMPDVECRTIHSFLGLKPSRKNGVETLVRGSKYDPSEFYDVRVVTLDEASMVDPNILKYVEQDISDWGRKYIALGDRYQLPPVSSETSPIFDLLLAEDQQTELTEIMRYAGPIIECATAVRDAIIQGVEPPYKSYLDENGAGVRCLRRDKWLSVLADITKHPEFTVNPDFSRVIAYRNQTVLEHIQSVRGFLGDDLSVPFQEGDFLVANEAWIQQDQVIFNTGAEFKVQATEPYTHPLYPELKGWQVWVEEYNETPIYVLNILQYLPMYKSIVARLAEEAKQPGGSWIPYYDLREWFADLRPTYGITAHKAQGSTFQNVFVDVKDMYKNPNKAEADRCLYVAITRAAKNVFLLL